MRWCQRIEERTWMLWGQKAGIVPRKGQGYSVAPGPCTSIQQLHNSRAQPPHCWPLEAFPTPATGPSLCLPSTVKINYQPQSGAAEEQWLMVPPSLPQSKEEGTAVTREMLRSYTPDWHPKVTLYPPCGQGGSHHMDKMDPCIASLGAPQLHTTPVEK